MFLLTDTLFITYRPDDLLVCKLYCVNVKLSCVTAHFCVVDIIWVVVFVSFLYRCINVRGLLSPLQLSALGCNQSLYSCL